MTGVEGRVALITGGGRGIGRATAELLASRGAQVMCVARSRQELADVGLEYSVADLGSPQEVAEVIAFLASEESSGVSGEAIRVALGGMC